MIMSDPSAISKMQGLFISCITLAAEERPLLGPEEIQKVAVQHVLTVIDPNSLRNHLTEDLEFSKHTIRKNFLAFIEHVINLAEAFQFVDIGRGCNSFCDLISTPHTRSHSDIPQIVPAKGAAVISPWRKSECLPPYLIMPECTNTENRHSLPIVLRIRKRFQGCLKALIQEL
eukprot:IDg6686t1